MLEMFYRVWGRNESSSAIIPEDQIKPKTGKIPNTERIPKESKPYLKSCLKKKPTFNTSLGPIRLVVIDRHGHYYWSMFICLFSTSCQCFIGAVNIMVLKYYIGTNDLHALLCTIGWHFLSIEAILALSYMNSWTYPLYFRHRILAHYLLQFCSVGCTATGSYLCLKNGIPTRNTPHGLAGLIAIGMTIATVVVGPLTFCQKPILSLLHMTLGLPAFVASSVCICLSFLLPSFQKETGELIAQLLTAFVCINTMFVILLVSMKFFLKIKYLHFM